MRHGRGLTGGVSCFSGCAPQVSRSAHGVSGGGTGLRHRDFPARPGTRLLNRPAGTVVSGLHVLKEMEDVLRAIRRPNGQQAMMGILEGTAAPHGYQPGVSVLAENHLSIPLCPACRAIVCISLIILSSFLENGSLNR